MARVILPKPATYRDPRLRELVARLPCVNCGVEGRTQAAHLNLGKAMGLKSSDAAIAALCCSGPGWQGCHEEYDQGKRMDKDERREFGQRVVMLTYVALMERGWLKIDQEAV